MSNFYSDTCPTCFEKFTDKDKPLKCGHWIHIECIRKGHKSVCHICRAPLDIEVIGKLDYEFPNETLINEELVSESDEELYMDKKWLKIAYKHYNPSDKMKKSIYYSEQRLQYRDSKILDETNDDDYDENSIEWDYSD